MIRFKYERFTSASGEILRPMANLALQANRRKIEVSMCIDSGADISMIPFRLGRALGFQHKSSDKILEISGVSGGTVPYVIKKARLTMDSEAVSARVAWALIEEVPLLLGRLDVFPRFRIVFDERRELVTFYPH